MANIKICLDAGHYGKYNRSPANKKYYESEMTWKLHLLLKEELEKYGFIITTTRTSQTNDLALLERGKRSEGCDLFISIHSNAVGSQVNDVVDYPIVYVPLSGKGAALGEKLADCIAEVIGTKQKGRAKTKEGDYGDWYGVMRGAASVGTTALLIEHSFHTNTNIANWLLVDHNLEQLAIAEAQIIADYYGMKKLPEVTNVQSPNTSKKQYQVRVICDSLNIRKTPKWGKADVVGEITDHKIYTIVDETRLGLTKFGKLKSGKGWISLGSKYVKKV